MIGNFEASKENLSISFCEINKMILSALRSIFFINPGYTFIDISDKSEWLTGIQNGDIIVLGYIEDVTSISEDHIFQITPNQIHISEFIGKYGYEILFNYSDTFYAIISALEQQDLDVIFGDVEGNMWLRSNLKGFTTELISFDKQNFTNKATQLNLWLWNPDEFKSIYKFKPDFNYRSLRQVPITLDNIIEVGTNTYQFTTSVTTLSINDISISDSVVVTGITSLTNLGGGVYQITTGQELNYGSINVQNDYYYGSGSYQFTQINLLLQEFTFVGGSYNYTFKLVFNDGDTYPPVNDFELDTNNITLYENSTPTVCTAIQFLGNGYYQITADNKLTEGSILASSETYRAFNNYLFDSVIAVDLSIGAYSLDTNYELYFTVENNGVPVSGISSGDFSFSHGTPLSVTEPSSGIYLASFSTPLNTGGITLSNTDYSGNVGYDVDGYYDNNNEILIGTSPAKISLGSGVTSSVTNGEMTLEGEGYIEIETTGVTEGNNHNINLEVIAVDSSDIQVVQDPPNSLGTIDTIGTESFDFISLWNKLYFKINASGGSVTLGRLILTDNGAATAIQLEVIAYSGLTLTVKVTDLSNVGITSLNAGNFRVRELDTSSNFNPTTTELSNINDIGIYKLVHTGGQPQDETANFQITAASQSDGYKQITYNANYVRWFANLNYSQELYTGVYTPIGITSTYLQYATSLGMSSVMETSIQEWQLENSNAAYDLDIRLIDSKGWDSAVTGTIRVTIGISEIDYGSLDVDISTGVLASYTTAGTKTLDIAYTGQTSDVYLRLKKTGASAAYCYITSLQTEFIP